MQSANLYETILKRRSIRKYDETPLNGNTLTGISAYINALKPMDDQIKIQMKLVSGEDMKSIPQ
ncbi:MAG TPA: nitroreductase family protein [Bacillota bacterium]|nr:nitroreductase family protein [Bacillota bacterium]